MLFWSPESLNLRATHRTVCPIVSLSVSFIVCLLACSVLQQLGFSVGICLDVSTCLTALGLHQFSVGKTNCSLCDFALSDPVCVSVCAHAHVCLCVWAYVQYLCVQKERKRNGQPYPERICVCARIRVHACVSEMRTRGQREHENKILCVCVCVSEKEREKQAASPLFSRAGYQAARQQGGIITEAVTFLWFLWFQHEAGGRLWLTHGCAIPAWKLLARGHNTWHLLGTLI